MVASAKGGSKTAKVGASKSSQPVLVHAKKSSKAKTGSGAASSMPKLARRSKVTTKTPRASASRVTKLRASAAARNSATRKGKIPAESAVGSTAKKSTKNIAKDTVKNQAKSAKVSNGKMTTGKIAQKKQSAPDLVRSKKFRSLPKLRLKKRRYNYASSKQPTFSANPLAEYADAMGRRRRKKRYIPRRRRIERQIMAMLACFSVSIGLWENFRQLWLQGNGFSATDVSNIVSFGLLLSVVGIIIVGKTVKMSKIKKFMFIVLVVRSVNMLTMCLLDNSNLAALINIGAALDVLTGTLIITSVYPLLTTVMKSNRAYSRRKLVEYLFRDIGVLIGGLLIGQVIAGCVVDYNVCLFISGGFSVAASMIMRQIKPIVTDHAAASKFSVKKYIWKNRIQRNYMIYAFLAGAAYMATIGLRMLVLTDFFGLSARMGTNYLLLVGLASDVLGILALKYFTPKNDYLTIAIKFGTRLVIFMGAFFTDSLFLCFIALTWTLLSSTAYENITDGYYINAIDNRHQLKYNTIKYVATTTGEAAGTFLCGQMFELGPKYIFGASGILIIIQLIVAFYLIYLRHQQNKQHKKTTIGAIIKR